MADPPKVFKSRVVGPLAVLVIVSSACTSSPEPQPPPDNLRLERGGTLRIVEPGLDAFGLPYISAALVKDFDPQRAYWGTAGELFRCCLLRTLVSADADPANRGKIVLRPDLAAAEPVVSADRLTWTFHLKPGLRYAPPLEDTPIVAGDIVRALERSGDPEILPEGTPYFFFSGITGFDEYRAGLTDSISGLETPDDLTLVIHLTEPAGDLPYLLAQSGSAPIPPNPLDARAQFGVATGHNRYGSFLVSSGPYMLEGSEDLDFSIPPGEQDPVDGFVPGESVTLVRNPSWERASDPLRPALVDRIVVTIGGSREDAFRAVESGSADLLLETLAGDDAQVRALRSAGLQEQIHVDAGMSTVYISMNLAVPPFDDIHVRKAVNFVIDRAGLMALAERSKNSFLDPVNTVATHFVPDILENGLLSEYDPYPTPGAHGDLRRARAEMRQSRYDANRDGVCDSPVCTDIVAPTVPDFVGRAGGALAARNLQTIGLNVRPEYVTFAENLELIQDPTRGTPLIIGRGWIIDYPNASNFFLPLFTKDGEFNSSLVGTTSKQLLDWGYSVSHVPSLDGRITECQALVGGEQIECWAALDKHLMDEVVPVVPLIWGRRALIVSERVARYSYDPLTLTPALDQIALRPESS